ncbi:MAG: patatin-like phospholipase family protein [Bacteroidales bacterium]|uniref:patatin-like phospholipase family protein n=1 Tax=Porphyromonas sp. TaxID=1924944 RepID=UPI0029740D43|nr:patatin-like phospholipase family protein [Porphyromonas sp.]MDD7437550.1 patatin-like phospholipase family protein [Bacteroidales bacterium]MDY3067130.1 patatin-like phospholipase family protein [Porphyromonas sp.]
MAYIFKNLVFEGGGVKGIAYAGALEVLREYKILPKIKRVAGTSAGAIMATLMGLGYTSKEIRDVFWALDFKNFMDDSWGILQDSSRLINKYGWYKGDFFRSFIGSLIKEKTGNSETTFADVKAMSKEGKPFLDIYLIGTNLSTGFSEVFSAEHTPRTCIADAARISMSIPLFFASVRNFRNDVYVDGAVLDNYPIKVFDREKYVRKNARRTDYYEVINEKKEKEKKRKISDYVYNKETLGFKLSSKEEIAMFRDNAEVPHRTIENFFDYTSALLHTLIDAQENTHLHSDDWQRTIYIDTLGVSAIDFKIQNAKKQELFDSGKSYTKSYLEWYDNKEPKANK